MYRRAEGEAHRAAPQGPYIALRQRRNTSLAQQTSLPHYPLIHLFHCHPELAEGSRNAKAHTAEKQHATSNTVQRSFDSACGSAQEDNGRRGTLVPRRGWAEAPGKCSCGAFSARPGAAHGCLCPPEKALGKREGSGPFVNGPYGRGHPKRPGPNPLHESHHGTGKPVPYGVSASRPPLSSRACRGISERKSLHHGTGKPVPYGVSVG